MIVMIDDIMWIALTSDCNRVYDKSTTTGVEPDQLGKCYGGGVHY